MMSEGFLAEITLEFSWEERIGVECVRDMEEQIL